MRAMDRHHRHDHAPRNQRPSLRVGLA